MTTLDVTDYGATGNGSDDDTNAIQQAIDEASDGDTVYFPEPSDYYRIEYSGDNTILVLDGSRHADDITLEGDGANTMIKLGSNPSNNYALLRIQNPSGWSATIRNMIWDGNRSVADNNSEPGHCLQFRDASGTGDIYVEDVVVQNGNTAGMSIQYGGVTVNRCTSRNNRTHGFVFATGFSNEHDPRSVIKNSLSTNNNKKRGYYCIDCSNGKGIVQDCVLQDGWGGTKTSEGSIDFTYRRVRIQNNEDAVMRNTSSGGGVNVEFEDVVAEGNAGSWRMGNHGNYSVIDDSAILAINNGDDGYEQIKIRDDATLDASDASVYSSLANGNEGLGSTTSASGSKINNYFYYQNDAGPTGSTDNLTINNQEEQNKTNISGVPSASDVGAWSSDTDSDTVDDSFDSWTPRWASTTDDWNIVPDSSFEGDNALEFHNNRNKRDRYGISWDEAGNPADVEVLDKFRVPSFNDDTSRGYHGRVYLRSSGSAGGENGYWIEIEHPENGFRLGKYTDNGLTTLARFGSPEENTFHYRRFRAEGDTLKAKVWPASEPEPSEWDVAVTDTDHVEGWVGLGSFDAEAVETDVISVGTGGKRASSPSNDGAPSVSWVAPGDGNIVSGTETIQIDASDIEDDSLVINFRTNEETWQATSYNTETGYYENTWDTTNMTDGDHTLEAEAIDSAGNSASTTISVSVDNALNIDTVGVNNVDGSSAALIGDLTSLNTADATGYFEWRQQGTDTWSTVGEQTLASTGEFSADLTGLSAETAYEFRAVVETSGYDKGKTRSFNTGVGGTSLSIDRSEVTDKSNPSWNWYEVDWSVSDPEGNLNTVISELQYGGSTVVSESTSVSGDTASFTHEIRVKGPVDSVSLSVNDVNNNTISEIKKV